MLKFLKSFHIYIYSEIQIVLWMIIASVDMYSGFISPLFLGPILCDIKKLMIFPQVLVEKMTQIKSGKINSWYYMKINLCIIFLKLNKNKHSNLQQQLVFTLFARSLHNVILIVMLI
jgi:hypothetical protein